MLLNQIYEFGLIQLIWINNKTAKILLSRYLVGKAV